MLYWSLHFDNLTRVVVFFRRGLAQLSWFWHNFPRTYRAAWIFRFTIFRDCYEAADTIVICHFFWSCDVACDGPVLLGLFFSRAYGMANILDPRFSYFSSTSAACYGPVLLWFFVFFLSFDMGKKYCPFLSLCRPPSPSPPFRHCHLADLPPPHTHTP